MIVHSLIVDETEPVPARRLDEKRADKIERILAASLRLFAERGFHGTAMPDIAAEAKIAPATIYRYFENKEALVNGVYRVSKSRLRSHLFDGLDITLEPRALFGSFFGRLISFARACPADFVFLEMQDHVPYLDAESRRIELGVLGPIGRVLAQLRERGVLGPIRPEIVIGMVWGAVVGLLKAERSGYLTVSSADLAAVEQASFFAITHHGAKNS
jgi:TetR/AcrR family transcriptional regulator, repressor of fatR-cypB operon